MSKVFGDVLVALCAAIAVGCMGITISVNHKYKKAKAEHEAHMLVHKQMNKMGVLEWCIAAHEKGKEDD